MIIAYHECCIRKIYSIPITVNDVDFIAEFTERAPDINIYSKQNGISKLVTVIPKPAYINDYDDVVWFIGNAFRENIILKYLVRYKEAL